MLRLRAFGGLALQDERPSPAAPITQPRSLALLALLANAGERPISRDKVLAYLCPETEPAKAAHRLAQSLYALRHDLGVDELFRASNDLRLNPRVIGSDLQDFTDALERGDLRRAVATYQGPFLDGFYLSGAAEFERWVETERGEYFRKYRSALEALALADGQRGDANGSAEWWRRLADADPLNARTAVAYMEALSVAAGHAGALQFARDYGNRLRDEFDSDPDPAVMAAAERLRNAASAGPTGPAIAVLPFLNLTPDRENEYFSDGMTEELAGALARVPGLRVVSRTSVFAFKGKDLDARQIAERLGVSILVEGSIRKIGNRIRLNAQLVNAVDGCDLWSESYERTMEHVFTLQEDLSQAIVAALPLAHGGPASSLVRRPTPALDAYTLYLRGRYSAHKRTVEGFTLAIEYFEQAVERDPGFALAHAGLAECWALRGFLEFGDLPPYEAMPKAKTAALESLRLEPRLPEGHTWLGVIHFLFDWDWPAAEQELRRALQLQPEHAYAETWYAMFLAAMGRHEEALQRILHAHALEPFSLSIRLCIGRCHYFARRYEEALACIEGILRDEPGHLLTTIWAARTLCAWGRFADALEITRGVPPQAQTPYLRSCAGYALAGLGRADEARSLCATLRRELDAGPPFTLFILGAAHARLGDLDTALDTLVECRRVRDGQLAFLLTQPTYDGLRGLPRFERLLADLHLPPQLLVPEAPGRFSPSVHALHA
jgi:TolB-like protein/Flp pilus assembly protein TadD